MHSGVCNCSFPLMNIFNKTNAISPMQAMFPEDFTFFSD